MSDELSKLVSSYYEDDDIASVSTRTDQTSLFSGSSSHGNHHARALLGGRTKLHKKRQPTESVDGDGDDIAESLVHRKHKKRKLKKNAVWDPTVRVDLMEEFGMEEQTVNGIESCPSFEIWARDMVRKLHAQLEEVCKRLVDAKVLARMPLKTSVTLRNGDALFEQWLFTSFSNRATSVSCVVPDVKGIAHTETFLMSELVKHIKDEKIAKQVTSQFLSGAKKLVRACKPPDVNSSKNRTRKVMLKGRLEQDDVYKLICGNATLKIGKIHYEKMHDLFERRCPFVGEHKFHRALFCLLQRYESIGGPGFQAALMGNVFDLLRDKMDVKCEVFASPFNCRFERFCSAFTEDKVFGSLGSFFEFQPLQGSFEANPPFVESTIIAMNRHIHNLLHRAETLGNAMSFVVIVPSRFRGLLQSSPDSNQPSPFHQNTFAINNRAHSYLFGHIHKKLVTIKSTCDTDIHVLQTSHAKTRWPFTDELKSKIITAFSKSRDDSVAF